MDSKIKTMLKDLDITPMSAEEMEKLKNEEIGGVIMNKRRRQKISDIDLTNMYTNPSKLINKEE